MKVLIAKFNGLWTIFQPNGLAWAFTSFAALQTQLNRGRIVEDDPMIMKVWCCR